MESPETMAEDRNVKLPRMPLRWDTNTAVAVIVLTSLVTIAALRGSLMNGGAIQP